MNYCPQCGAQLENDARFCPGCGAKLDNGNTSNQTTDQVNQYAPYQAMPNQNASYQAAPNQDDGGAGWKVLSFFIPLVGLILFLVWNNEAPRKAKACGKWALIGFITGIVISVLAYCASFSILMGAYGSLGGMY